VPKAIEYLSQPATVSMADQWFEIASIDHFWIRRRFRVLQSMADEYIQKAGEMAEIGCGNGLLQKQIEIGYQRSVIGLDLNEHALKRNVSTRSRICCYNILDRNPNLEGAFDLIFLFDVLEHIENEGAFLNAALFHLAANGKVVINVPAGPWAFSAYDRAAGHVRRYWVGSLTNVAQRNALDVIAWTYWGLPLVPTLALRKIWLSLSRDQNSTIRKGFDSRSPFVNRVFATLSRLESIPQRVLGTSLMAVLKRRTAGGPDGR
jgi:SAM-dependent methyltransferase